MRNLLVEGYMSKNRRTVCAIHKDHENELKSDQSPYSGGQSAFPRNSIQYREEGVDDRELCHPNDEHSFGAKNIGELCKEEALENTVHNTERPHYKANSRWGEAEASKRNGGGEEQRLNSSECNLKQRQDTIVSNGDKNGPSFNNLTHRQWAFQLL